MWIYFVIFVVIAICSLLRSKLKNSEQFKCRKLLIIICEIVQIFILVLFFGFRNYDVGTDTNSYYNIFMHIGKSFSFSTLFEYEFLYCLLNAICYSISKNFTLCLFIIGIIIYTNLVFSINRLSDNPIISFGLFLALGMYSQSFNLIRQYLAISFVMLSLYFLIKKNSNIKFLACVCIAFLFHKTAIICILFPLLKKIKFCYNSVAKLYCISVAIIIFFPSIVSLFDAIMGTSYYTNYANITIENFNMGIVLVIIIIIFAISFLLIFRKKKAHVMKESLTLFEYWCVSLVVSGLIKFISYFTVELVDRLSIYFICSILFIVPMILKFVNKKFRISIYISMCIVLPLFLYYVLIIRGSYQVIPYEFVFKGGI